MAGGATAERTEKEKSRKITGKELWVGPAPGCEQCRLFQYPVLTSMLNCGIECCIVTMMFKLSHRILNCSLGDLCVILNLELLRRMLNCSFADRCHLGYWIVPLHSELSSCMLHYKLECMNCGHFLTFSNGMLHCQLECSIVNMNVEN